jgi:hypothetical protein
VLYAIVNAAANLTAVVGLAVHWMRMLGKQKLKRDGGEYPNVAECEKNARASSQYVAR